MRQKDIKRLLLEVQPDITILRPEKTSSGSFWIHHLLTFQKAIDRLLANNLLVEPATEIKNSWIFQFFDEMKLVEPQAWNSVAPSYYRLQKDIESFLAILDKNDFDVPIGISIKLPRTNGFDELATYATELNQAIGLLVSEEEIGGRVKIEAVDNGSIWLYVSLGTTIAVSLVGKLLEASAGVYKKWLEAFAYREHLKNLKIQNEVAQKLADAQKEFIDLYVMEEVKQIDEEFFKKRDPERVQRLKNSIAIFSELLPKGLNVQPSDSLPAEVRSTFPDVESLTFQPSETKQLPTDLSDIPS